MTLLSWLLTYAIHSTILLALAAIAAWWFADKHAWLDLIWKFALIGPLVTASLHLNPIALPLGGRWAIPSVTTVTGSPVPTPTPTPSDETPVAAGITAERATLADVDRVAKSEDPAPVREAQFTLWPEIVRSWPSIAAALWLFIAVGAVVRYGVRLRRVYRALCSGAPVTTTYLLDTIESLRSGANPPGTIRLTTSVVCPVPLVLAGRRIVLPERFVDDLDPEQQRAALAHEVAHVVRRDPEWCIAIEILERALFFQPLNRLARARLRDSAEFLCDEWAVQQTQSPLALARCLSIVASWWSPADDLPAGVSAMARSDSAMVRRVTRILNEPATIARPRLLWLAIPVTFVAVAAPRVAATQLPALAVTPAVAAVLNAHDVEKATEQRDAQLRVYRSPRPGASLDERWREAVADAARQRLADFWIVYTFNTPTHGDELTMSDTREGSFVVSDGRFSMQGPPLSELFNPSAVMLEGGNIAVLLHYRSGSADAIDRASYRSVQLGFDFGRTPVFFLGDAPASQSFDRVQSLFGQARVEEIQTFLIELASRHPNSNVVIPFLARLVDQSYPPAIRSEAAEGFEHHHDPRSVEILLRVARTDPDSGVRAEAAEAIGEVQTPQSTAALTDLVKESTDPEVRREAAEAFGSQPAERAIPAIEAVIATSEDEDAVSEAVEALGEIDAPGVVDVLTRIAWEHRDVAVQKEAVETLGDRDGDAAAMTALERIAREHDREDVQAEAIETLADLSEQSLHPLLIELAVSGRSARIRREALESIGDALEQVSDATVLDRAQQAIERAVFDDPDRAVQMEALDALDNLPNDRALRALRDVIARHPDARVRKEAEDHVRERQ